MQITYNTHEKRLFGKYIDRVTPPSHTAILSSSLSCAAHLTFRILHNDNCAAYVAYHAVSRRTYEFGAYTDAVRQRQQQQRSENDDTVQPHWNARNQTLRPRKCSDYI